VAVRSASLVTTALLTVDETMDALRKAGQVCYTAPGALTKKFTRPPSGYRQGHVKRANVPGE
jgi:hypothetical protein